MMHYSYTSKKQPNPSLSKYKLRNEPKECTELTDDANGDHDHNDGST